MLESSQGGCCSLLVVASIVDVDHHKFEEVVMEATTTRAKSTSFFKPHRYRSLPMTLPHIVGYATSVFRRPEDVAINHCTGFEMTNIVRLIPST